MTRKKIFSLLTALLLGCTLLSAQQYDVLDKVRADVRKSWGMEGPYRLEEMDVPSKPPKGYKPFYISHYGRHGSRYCWSAKTYSLLADVFTKAQKLDVLTPYGESFARKYLEFYEVPFINTGDLVPLGFQQHIAIGEYVYKHFPQVFKGDRQVDALSSTAQRCILSMSGFVQGLTAGNGRLQVRQDSNHAGMAIIAPPSAPGKFLRHFKGETDPVALESVEDFTLRMGLVPEILEKLFTDSSFLEEFNGGSIKFVNELWQFCSNYHNYETQPLFDDLFSDDQRVKAWEISNYSSFYTDLRQRYSTIPLLEDIIGKADFALHNPAQAAHLRFGHDYIVEAFATLINLNGCGTIPSRSDEAKYWFQSYNVSKATTLLFVFYKSKKADILFKVLWNGQEAKLPQLQAVEGPYYSWGDFVDWARDLMEAHPQVK